MLIHMRPAIAMLLIFTALTGFAYPLAVTGLAQLIFPAEANGSLIRKDGRVIGAAMIGQSFTSNRYFHGRPSAANYNAAASTGSNLAPTSEVLVKAVRERALTVAAQDKADSIPADLVTSSASGLDPDISPEAATIQAPRVAAARGLPVEAVQKLVADATEGRTLGFLGEPRVNVLKLNMLLDAKH
jgi:potassium-transporting ATPase KdpC subunit